MSVFLFAFQEQELLCIQLELIIYSSVSWHSNVGDYYKKKMMKSLIYLKTRDNVGEKK